MPLALLIQTTAPSSPSSGFGLPLMLLMFVGLYVLLFLPAMRQRKKRQKMLQALQPGQLVLTNGGIIGHIVTINEDDTLILRVKPDNLRLHVDRSAVASVAPVAEEKK
ncbi:MAG: preprotein translocase subunit YajC [Acidobacteria bacterium]|nr:preprotein translocase subunit YajC [Acidobacteriota bacterium]